MTPLVKFDVPLTIDLTRFNKKARQRSWLTLVITTRDIVCPCTKDVIIVQANVISDALSNTTTLISENPQCSVRDIILLFFHVVLSR